MSGRFLKIDEMFAFISVDEKGEGICGFRGLDGVFMPMVGTDLQRVDSLKPMAQLIANQSKKTIKICKFAAREQIGEIGPES